MENVTAVFNILAENEVISAVLSIWFRRPRQLSWLKLGFATFR